MSNQTHGLIRIAIQRQLYQPYNLLSRRIYQVLLLSINWQLLHLDNLATISGAQARLPGTLRTWVPNFHLVLGVGSQEQSLFGIRVPYAC